MARGENKTKPSSRSTVRGHATFVDIDLPALPNLTLADAPAQSVGAYLGADQILSLEHDSSLAGQLVTLRSGESVEMDDQMGAMFATGADLVVHVDHDPETSIVKVRFADRANAIVSADRRQVMCSCPANPCPHRQAAIAVALGLESAEHPLDAADREDMYRAMSQFSESKNVRDLEAAAVAFEDALLELGGYSTDDFELPEIWIEREQIVGGEFDVIREREILPEAEGSLQELGAAMDKVQEAADSSDMLLDETMQELDEVLSAYYDQFWTPEEQKLRKKADEISDRAEREKFLRENNLKIPQGLIKAREETSQTLGIPIPDIDPMIDTKDEEFKRIMEIVVDEMANGGRSFGFYGPQGTGKNTLPEWLAAKSRMPIIEIDCSDSTEFAQLLASTGLEANEAGGTSTKTNIGPALRAASNPGGAIIVFNEIASAPRSQLTTIHNLLGSKTTAEGRHYSPPSSDGGAARIDIDPQTAFFVTWNPDRDHWMPHQALSSRMAMVDFRYPKAEDEAQRVALRVWESLGEEWKASAIDDDYMYDPTAVSTDEQGRPRIMPIKDQAPKLFKTILQDVEFFRKLREEYNEGGNISHCPDMRTMVRYSRMRIRNLLNEKMQDKATQKALNLVTFMVEPDGSSTPDDRYADLINRAKEHYGKDDPGLSKVNRIDILSGSK